MYGAESGKVQKKRRVRTAIKTVTTTTERERIISLRFKRSLSWWVDVIYFIGMKLLLFLRALAFRILNRVQIYKVSHIDFVHNVLSLAKCT